MKYLLVTFVSLCLAHGAFAESENQFRFGGGYYLGGGDGGGFLDVAAGDGPGFFAEYERQFTDRFSVGLEFNAAFLSHEDGYFTGSGLDSDITFLTLTANPYFYLYRNDSGFSAYLAPIIGVGMIDSDSSGALSSDFSESAFLFGARLGGNIPMGESGWTASVRVNYVVGSYDEPSISTSSSDENEAGLLSLTLGFGRSF